MNEKQLEEYLNQLRALGLDEKTIELYRQQLSQTSEAINNFSEQFSQLMNLSDSDLENESAVVLAPQTNLTTAQQWAVACGADLAMLNGHPLNTLETGNGMVEVREMLSEWWDIDDRNELVNSISWLKEEGHRYDFELIADAYRTLEASEVKKYIREDLNGKVDPEQAIEWFRNVRDAFDLFVQEGLLPSSDKTPNLLAWDYVRAINLCRNGIDAEYISQEEALSIAMEFARQLQQTYSSWKELSVAYQFGRYIWGGSDQFEYLVEGMNVMLTDSASPWVTLPWNTPLN